MPLVKADCSVDKCKQQFWLLELLDLNWCKQQSINFICASSRINDAPSAAQETSLDTGRTGLLSEACSSAVASCSAPSAPPHSCKEKRHWSKEHSSPPSSTETLLSPSLNHDLAPSFPRRMFPLWACSCHDTVQRRVAVVPSNATGTPKTWTLYQCFEFGYMKYAMFAGLHGSFSAALCFEFGSWPRRALSLWQSPLLLCRTRSVCCGAILCMARLSAWLEEFVSLSAYHSQYALKVKGLYNLCLNSVL